MAEDKKNTQLIVFIIISVIIAVIFVFNYKKLKTDLFKEKRLIVPIVSDADLNNLPKVISELQVQNGAKIKNAYSATYPDSTAQQVTAVFSTTSKSAESYDVYLKWAKDNGWKVVNSSESPNLSSLYLRKGSEDINITIDGYLISISYLNSAR